MQPKLAVGLTGRRFTGPHHPFNRGGFVDHKAAGDPRRGRSGASSIVDAPARVGRHSQPGQGTAAGLALLSPRSIAARQRNAVLSAKVAAAASSIRAESVRGLLGAAQCSRRYVEGVSPTLGRCLVPMCFAMSFPGSTSKPIATYLFEVTWKVWRPVEDLNL